MDRMAGLQDVQDKLCWAKLGVKNGQDGRISGLTGQGVNAQLGAKNGQDFGIAGLTSNLPLVKKIERKEKRVNRDQFLRIQNKKLCTNVKSA